MLPYRPIPKPGIRVATIAQNGRPRCSIFLGSLRIRPPVVGFGAFAPTGGSALAVLTTSLRTSLRNQMLELHFDAEQGRFLGQLAGNEITITFAPQGLTKTDLMGELGYLLSLPVYQLALPFTYEAWRQLEYTRVLAGTTL